MAIRRTELLRERLTIRLGPGAILGHGLQGRPASGPAGTWTFHLGFGYAGARFRFQTGADVNDLVLDFGVVRGGILRLTLGSIPGLILSSAARRDQGQRE